jgi:hypothetical protein
MSYNKSYGTNTTFYANDYRICYSIGYDFIYKPVFILGAHGWISSMVMVFIFISEFYGGVLNATGYPIIDFSWYQSGEMIRSNYLFYGIDVYYNASTDELYSPGIANVTLVR